MEEEEREDKEDGIMIADITELPILCSVLSALHKSHNFILATYLLRQISQLSHLKIRKIKSRTFLKSAAN